MVARFNLLINKKMLQSILMSNHIIALKSFNPQINEKLFRKQCLNKKHIAAKFIIIKI